MNRTIIFVALSLALLEGPQHSSHALVMAPVVARGKSHVFSLAPANRLRKGSTTAPYKPSAQTGNTPTNSGSLEDSVAEALTANGGWPFLQGLHSGHMLRVSDKVVFESEFYRVKGKDAYLTEAELWKSQINEEAGGQGVRFEVIKVSQVEPLTVTVRFNISWTPPDAKPLLDIAAVFPSLRIIPVSLLDRIRERSRFSWAAVWTLVCSAATKGILPVPQAEILGRTRLVFEEWEAGGYELVRHVERIDLVNSLDTGELQNRPCARNLLLFLDSRRPEGVKVEEWNEKVLARADVTVVPGMGSMDVDGLNEAPLLSDLVAAAALGAVYLTVFAAAFFIATGYVTSEQNKAAASVESLKYGD